MAISREEYSKEQLKDTLLRLFENIGDVFGMMEYLGDEESDDEVLFEKTAEEMAEDAYEKVLQNMCWPSFMEGHYPDGTKMFEHEFLEQPACLIHAEVDESVMEGFDLFFFDEIWLLANGDVAHVENIDFTMGGFRLSYRRLKGLMSRGYSLPFCSEDVLYGLDTFIGGGYDEETSYEKSSID